MSEKADTVEELLASYEQALNLANKMLKKGIFSTAEANKAKRTAKVSKDAGIAALYKAAKNGRAKAPATGECNATEEADDDTLLASQSKVARKISWPCSDERGCSIAETYTTFSQGKEAVKAALQKSTLYKDIKDNRAALSERSAKHVGGAGVPARGKLDWEFVCDTFIDQKLCDTFMIHARYMRYTHDTSHDIYVHDTRAIHARYTRYTRDILDTCLLLECTCLAPHPDTHA